MTQNTASTYTLAETTDSFSGVTGSACAPTKGAGHPECLIAYEGCTFRDIAQNAIGAHSNPIHVRNSRFLRIGKHRNAGTLYNAGANNIVENSYFEDNLTPITFWHQGVFDTHDNIARNNTIVRGGVFWDSMNGNHESNGGPRYEQGQPNPGGGWLIQQSNGSRARVSNNVFIDSSGPHIVVTHGSNDCLVANNTISSNCFTSSTEGFDSSWMGAITLAYPSPSTNSTDNCRIQNNIVYTPDSDMVQIMVGGSSHQITHNLTNSGDIQTDSRPNLTVNNNTAGNPNFRAADDPHLTSGSTHAIDTGTALTSFFSTDFEGTLRPIGDAWDRGAYEFGTPTEPPNPCTNAGPDRLLGHWLFDEASGTTADDASGQGRTGTLHGGVTRVGGIVGSGAVHIDGDTQYVEVLGHADLRPTTEFGITARIRVSSMPTAGSRCELFSMGNAIGLGVRDTGGLHGFFYDGAGYQPVDGSGNLLSGVNEFAAFTREPNTGGDMNGDLRLYWGASEIGFAPSRGSVSHTLGANLQMGRHGNGASGFHCDNLILDDVRYYGRYLDAEAVRNIHKGSVTESGLTMSGMVWTLPHVVGEQALTPINSDRSQRLNQPIGLWVAIQNGSDVEVVEHFQLGCCLLPGCTAPEDFIAVTNSFNAVGVRIGEDREVNMGAIAP